LETDILIVAVSVPEKGPLMNSWLHKWLEGLGTAYPSASSSYWRAMPLGRMKKLLAAAFFTVSALGFVLDLLLLNHPHLGRGLVWPLLLGALAAGTLAARIKGTHLYPPIWLILAAVSCLALSSLIPPHACPSQKPSSNGSLLMPSPSFSVPC